MVTLPELDSYSPKERRAFTQYSPLFEHYLNLLSREPQDPSESIRHLKHQHWLRCAYATLKGEISTEDICRYWSDRSDEIIAKAWSEAGLLNTPAALFAMGKLGSRELNLSSDIDIFFVTDDPTFASEASSKLKKFIHLLSANTSMGFAYRVDTSLRPGGSMAPLLPSAAHFFNYFDEYTEAWNRMSFIRLRSLEGPPSLTKKIEDYCHRLSYPRRLDFSIIEEIKSIRSKIEFQWRKSNEPLDIKLHPGGIRDIELYMQALQVIYGGRQPQLQTSSITAAIQLLCEHQVIDQEEKTFFTSFYWRLRDIENHIHIYEDKHTYILKEPIVQKMEGHFEQKTFDRDIGKSTRLIGEFFSPPGDQDNKETHDVNDLSEGAQKAVNDILSLKSHSLKKGENERRKKSILEKFIVASQQIDIDPDLALGIFRDFIFSIRSKSSIFHLLDRHDELLENLSWLFSVSPYVGRLLCRRPELIDSFVLGKVDLTASDSIESLMENLMDYKLLGQMVSIVYFIKDRDVETFTTQLTRHADIIVRNLLDELADTLKSDGVEVLCLGKWSGLELGIQSDLDFVFLTDGAATDQQRKLVKRFINLITSATSSGRLYNVDMRLKPNESAGPLLIEKKRLLEFVTKKAEPWQKQAYFRSRLLHQTTPFFQKNMDLLKINSDECIELDKIHARLLKVRSNSSIDIKASSGGLIASEFAVQKCLLRSGTAPDGTSTRSMIERLPHSRPYKEQLANNYLFLRRFEQTFQICNSTPSTKVSKGNEGLSRLRPLMKLENPFETLQSVMDDQQELLKDLT